MEQVRAHLMVALVAVLGIIGGGWTVMAPFATSFPWSKTGGWTHSITSTVITGAVVLVASIVLLVLEVALATRAGIRAKAAAAAQRATP